MVFSVFLVCPVIEKTQIILHLGHTITTVLTHNVFHKGSLEGPLIIFLSISLLMTLCESELDLIKMKFLSSDGISWCATETNMWYRLSDLLITGNLHIVIGFNPWCCFGMVSWLVDVHPFYVCFSLLCSLFPVQNQLTLVQSWFLGFLFFALAHFVFSFPCLAKPEQL